LDQTPRALQTPRARFAHCCAHDAPRWDICVPLTTTHLPRALPLRTLVGLNGTVKLSYANAALLWSRAAYWHCRRAPGQHPPPLRTWHRAHADSILTAITRSIIFVGEYWSVASHLHTAYLSLHGRRLRALTHTRTLPPRPRRSWMVRYRHHLPTAHAHATAAICHRFGCTLFLISLKYTDPFQANEAGPALCPSDAGAVSGWFWWRRYG